MILFIYTYILLKFRRAKKRLDAFTMVKKKCLTFSVKNKFICRRNISKSFNNETIFTLSYKSENSEFFSVEALSVKRSKSLIRQIRVLASNIRSIIYILILVFVFSASWAPWSFFVSYKSFEVQQFKEWFIFPLYCCTSKLL